MYRLLAVNESSALCSLLVYEIPIDMVLPIVYIMRFRYERYDHFCVVVNRLVVYSWAIATILRAV